MISKKSLISKQPKYKNDKSNNRAHLITPQNYINIYLFLFQKVQSRKSDRCTQKADSTNDGKVKDNWNNTPNRIIDNANNTKQLSPETK